METVGTFPQPVESVQPQSEYKHLVSFSAPEVLFEIANSFAEVFGESNMDGNTFKLPNFVSPAQNIPLRIFDLRVRDSFIEKIQTLQIPPELLESFANILIVTDSNSENWEFQPNNIVVGIGFSKELFIKYFEAEALTNETP